MLTANYAFAQGYEKLYMVGLSGGGWSTTFAAAIDKRYDASYPLSSHYNISVTDSYRRSFNLQPTRNFN